MKFTKMHGLGNDFIIFEDLNDELDLSCDLISKLCNRRFGIGADGLMTVKRSSKADVKMNYYNSDGNQVEMCGNGIRCFSKYVYEKGIVKKNPLDIETLAGIKTTSLYVDGPLVKKVKVDMGQADFLNFEDEIIEFEKTQIKYRSVSMGNPHVVIIVEDLENYPVEKIGPYIENHPLFPNRTNVNFVEVIDKSKIKVVTWERGVGLTLACGTGTCASVVAANDKGLVDKKVEATLLGGTLLIDLDDGVFMTGDAVKVFEGDVDVLSL